MKNHNVVKSIIIGNNLKPVYTKMGKDFPRSS